MSLGIPFDVLVLCSLLCLAGIVAYVEFRRPEALRAHYDLQIMNISKEYEARLTEVKETVRELRSDLMSARAEVKSIAERMTTLQTEYLWIVSENNWLKMTLARHDIQIPPLPDSMRPRVDRPGISVNVNEGGIHMSGSSHMDAGRDVTGRDRTGN